MGIEVGAGFGLTSATDHVVLKLILARDSNLVHRTGVSAPVPNRFN
jgi:hypothetical protein